MILLLIVLLFLYLPLIAVVGSFLLSLVIVHLTRNGYLGLVYKPAQVFLSSLASSMHHLHSNLAVTVWMDPYPFPPHVTPHVTL